MVQSLLPWFSQIMPLSPSMAACFSSHSEPSLALFFLDLKLLRRGQMSPCLPGAHSETGGGGERQLAVHEYSRAHVEPPRVCLCPFCSWAFRAGLLLLGGSHMSASCCSSVAAYELRVVRTAAATFWSHCPCSYHPFMVGISAVGRSCAGAFALSVSC